MVNSQLSAAFEQQALPGMDSIKDSIIVIITLLNEWLKRL
jgi:hypothetical protein